MSTSSEFEYVIVAGDEDLKHALQSVGLINKGNGLIMENLKDNFRLLMKLPNT